MNSKKITTAEITDMAIQIIAERIRNAQDQYDSLVNDVKDEAGSFRSVIMNSDSIKRNIEKMEYWSDCISENRRFLGMLKEIRESTSEEAQK